MGNDCVNNNTVSQDHVNLGQDRHATAAYTQGAPSEQPEPDGYGDGWLAASVGLVWFSSLASLGFRQHGCVLTDSRKPF